MIPEEDRGPAWLRDYGGSIEADIQRMEEFAKQLMAEVQKSYVPHMEEVQSDMLPDLPAPVAFPELHSFMHAHREAQQNTSDRVWDVGNGTGGLATAAETVSKNYGKADAFSYARVRDVENALDQTGVAAAPPPNGSQSTATPQGSTDSSGSPNA